ncbi:MAG: BrnA antitoxin family protein [Spirochaetales bacterium]|nr:BrnA antitoxin family protein [Spirochaetales bacterium]
MKQENGFSPMDEDTKKRLAALAEMSDSDIDTSDIGEWTDEDFSKAVPFHDIYRPRKEQITTRIDADVLVWLKSHGKGYQTLLNDLLRKEMMEELEKTG